MAGSFNERFTAFRPSKTMWFWSTVGTIIVVIVIGFTWGGWVTSGSAAQRAADAAENARAELAANICVHRFLAAPDAATALADLKDAASYQRASLVEKGGWVTFAGGDEPVEGAADLCADQLAEAKLPAEPMAAASAEGQTTVAD